MHPPLPQDVRDAADTSAIVQLVLAERECRDLGRWARMRECFPLTACESRLEQIRRVVLPRLPARADHRVCLVDEQHHGPR